MESLMNGAIDVRRYNREAWNRQVEDGNQWTVPVTPEQIAAARRGDWHIVLTPTRPVPREWYPSLAGCDVLCLASGGGQQGPILAAVGAHVTVLDNSPRQLAQDRLVAEREGLDIHTVEGDMADLHMLSDKSFGLIVHPVSNVFAPDVRPVWREACRVLRHGGVLMAGFMNPDWYLFDHELAERSGEIKVRYHLPYSDVESLRPEQRAEYLRKGWPLEFSHSLESQIGGQLEAGLVLTHLFEDRYPNSEANPVAPYMFPFIATRAVKP
jgi:SAM-dependent methyltransferase